MLWNVCVLSINPFFCLFGRVTLLESAFGVTMDAWCDMGTILCLSSCVMDLSIRAFSCLSGLVTLLESAQGVRLVW